MKDIRDILSSIGLAEYAQAFEQNDIDADVYGQLSADDLKELGVGSLGHRKRILAAIAAELQDKPPAPTGLPAVPATKPSAGERREVTVMFADLTGYTRLSRELETEDLHEVQSEFFEQVDAITKRMGGTVERHIGDCIMAVFGAPVSYGNDAERAVRTSIALHDAMADISRKFGRSLTVHNGVASGNVLFKGTGHGLRKDLDFSVTGDTINLAARLASKANAGETFVCEDTYLAVSNKIACDDPEHLDVKGFEKAVVVRRVRAVREQQEIGVFVGRTAELSLLRESLAQCQDGARGKMIHIRADAGMGKSRLIDEFIRLAGDQGFEAYKALVLDFGLGESQDPITVLLSEVCGLGQKPVPSAVRDLSARLLADRILDKQAVFFVQVMLGMALDGDARAIFDAMSEEARARGRVETLIKIVSARASKRPLLLAIEDIHWAGPQVMAQLAALAAQTAQTRFIVVMASRLEGDPIDEDVIATIGQAQLVQINLQPMSPTECLQMAGVLRDSTQEAIRECITRAEGNPLFLDQLLRHTREHGLGSIPGSIQSIVQARLDKLGEVDRQVLQAAAVVGQRFALDTATAIAGVEVFDAQALIQASLIRPLRNEYLFAHALIRDSVRKTILRAELRRLHLAAARWFEGSDAVLHAEHLEMAADDRASAAFLNAAQEAVRGYRKESALSLSRRGLALQASGDVRGRLLRIAGDMLRDLGDSKQSIVHFEDALAVAQTPRDTCLARIGIVAAMRIMDQIDQAHTVLDEAEQSAVAEKLYPELSEIHYFRGSLYFPRGNLQGCLEQHAKSLEYAERLGLPERQARALSGLGDAYYAQGRMSKSHEVFEQCLALCDEYGLGAVAAANRFMLGTVKIYLNETERALGETLRSADLAVQIAQLRPEIVSRLTAGWILLSMARYQAARTEVERGLVAAGQLGAKRFEPFLEESLARVQLGEGDKAAAAVTAERALSKARDQGAMSFIGPWLLSTVALTTTSDARLAEVLAEGKALLASGCVGHNYFNFYKHAMDVCLERKDWDGARGYAADLDAYTQAEPAPWSTLFSARARAIADVGENGHNPLADLTLTRLVEQAQAARLIAALPAMNEALNLVGAASVRQ